MCVRVHVRTPDPTHVEGGGISKPLMHAYMHICRPATAMLVLVHTHMQAGHCPAGARMRARTYAGRPLPQVTHARRPFTAAYIPII